MTGTRRAILIGNATYPADPALPPLACPPNDVAGLAALLRDPARGGFAEVKELVDADSMTVRRALAGFIRTAGPEDTLLIYYSGHGKLDDSLALHLCTKDSETKLLEATSVPMGYVWDLEAKCSARRRVILLDCCYSGAAAHIRARGNVADRLRAEAGGAGTYLLTASDAIETAQEKEGERYGVFTKHLIAGIESGEADSAGEGEITMDALYEYVCREVRTDAAQKPTRQVGGQGEIVIARSGRDSRKDRAAAARKLLLGKAAEDLIGMEVAQEGVRVARLRPLEMSESERAVDAALSDFLAGKIGPGQFSDRVNEVPASVAAPRAPRERPNLPGEKQQAPRERPERIRQPVLPDAGDATPPALSPRMMNYGLPAITFGVLFFVGQVTGGSPLPLAIIALGPSLWILTQKRPLLSLGGIIANVAILLFGVLFALAFLLDTFAGGY
jgi:hypothetical protein